MSAKPSSTLGFERRDLNFELLVDNTGGPALLLVWLFFRLFKGTQDSLLHL